MVMWGGQIMQKFRATARLAQICHALWIFAKNTCLHNAPGERMALEELKQPLIKCIMAALNPPLESVDGYNYAPRRGFSWPPCPILTHFCSADDLRNLGFAIHLATYSHGKKTLQNIFLHKSLARASLTLGEKSIQGKHLEVNIHKRSPPIL